MAESGITYGEDIPVECCAGSMPLIGERNHSADPGAGVEGVRPRHCKICGITRPRMPFSRGARPIRAGFVFWPAAEILRPSETP